jgi:hypothetical protein
MIAHLRRSRPAARAALTSLTLLLVAGCASADKTTSTTTKAAAAGSSMAGMNMGSGSGMSVNGIKPIPTQTLVTADWQDMKVSARAMTAVPFVVYDGTSERTIKPGKNTTFHLMVYLDDARTHVPIPYAGVWATIRQADKLIYDERMWPMICEYMGPHYGNDVKLPGKGTYQLSLLISPPVSARHVEYQQVWLRSHRINTTFMWRGA